MNGQAFLKHWEKKHLVIPALEGRGHARKVNLEITNHVAEEMSAAQERRFGFVDLQLSFL